ncbi:MAG: DMT family transporter [Candidatus Acidiferrum sp.]|jgi:drug/metabolite transporter (DMT)-like permease
MGILFGLLTALSWGSSDLLARFATRKIGTFRAMLYMQLTGLLLLTLALHWMGGWGHLIGFGWEPWAWGICAGVLNTAATLALYRSFEIGKMSIVAPISASYPGLTMLLAGLTGERLTPLRLAGLLLILLGVAIVSRGEEIPGDKESMNPKAQPGQRHLGVGWALLSALGFGLLFWVLGTRAVPLLGSAQTVWLIRLTCVVLTLLVMLLLRQPKGLPQAGASWTVLGMGLLDTSAYVLNNYGIQLEQVSVVSVLASLYSAVTVALAATILGEKVTRMQWTGIVAVFAGIVLISR